MKAVILAGGLGSRLRPFTKVIPKPLLPIGDKSILEVQIERLKSHGFDEIFLATNYKSEYIEKFFGNGERLGVRLVISKETEPLGTAGPLKLLEDELQDPFLVMNGDILTLMDFSKFYRYSVMQDTLLTIAIKKIITPYDFGNILFDGDYVTSIVEKPDFVNYALAGIYIMKPEILNHIPANSYYGMDKLMTALLTNHDKIAKYELKEYWLDIGRTDDYEKAQQEYFLHLSDAKL